MVTISSRACSRGKNLSIKAVQKFGILFDFPFSPVVQAQGKKLTRESLSEKSNVLGSKPRNIECE